MPKYETFSPEQTAIRKHTKWGLVEDNIFCTNWLGLLIESKYVKKLFGNIKPNLNYPKNGYDWTSEDGLEVKHLASCLHIREGRNDHFQYLIGNNKMPDKFVLTGWSDRIMMLPLHIWIVDKEARIRNKLITDRQSLFIPETVKGLRLMKQYEVTDMLNELKDLCRKDKIHDIDYELELTKF